MTYKIMLERARDHVARHLDCRRTSCWPRHVLCGEPPGRGSLFRGLHHGAGVVVSASPELLPRVEPLLTGKSRDEAFEFPLVYGQSLYYLPDLGRFHPLPLPEGYQYRLLAGGR